MSTGLGEEGGLEALVLLRPEEFEGVERAIEAIEAEGGTVLLCIAPHTLVACLTAHAVTALRGRPGIASVDTGPVDEGRLTSAAEPVRTAFAMWNERLDRAKRSARATPGAGLSWDAPGFLPPDPPADVRERLRRREEEPPAGTR